jgi:hypothetical protein
MRTKVFLGLAAALVLSLVAQPALAGISDNTFDPTGTLSPNGRQLVVTGTIACTAGDRLVVSVTVTQNDPGAIATGSSRATCSGEDQAFSDMAHAQGPSPFVLGSASACAVAVTSNHGVITGTDQWCAPDGVTLEEP